MGLRRFMAPNALLTGRAGLEATMLLYDVSETCEFDLDKDEGPALSVVEQVVMPDDDLSARAERWAKSEAGQRAMAEARRLAQETIDFLAEARKVRCRCGHGAFPCPLHTPMI